MLLSLKLLLEPDLISVRQALPGKFGPLLRGRLRVHLAEAGASDRETESERPDEDLPRSSSASASAGVEKRKRERAGWASSASILGPIASRMSGRVRMAKAR